MVTRSVETTIVRSRICKCHSIFVDNVDSLGTSFLKTSEVESGQFGSCVSRLENCSNLPNTFAHTKMKAVRGIYGCGQPAWSKN